MEEAGSTKRIIHKDIPLEDFLVRRRQAGTGLVEILGCEICPFLSRRVKSRSLDRA